MFKLKNIFFKKGCSIIIPTWNCADTLTKCLLSLENALPINVDYEIIFVDNESTDNTIADIKYIMKNRYPKIQYKIITETGPLGKARLVGLDAAKYGTVFWLDSDIVLPVNYVYDLFDMAEKLKEKFKYRKSKEHVPINKIYGLQGWMDSRGTMNERQNIWHRWWHGLETDNFKNKGYNLGSPTANLICLNDYKLTKQQRQELSELKCYEDNYLASVVRKQGYEMYALDIPTPHLKFHAQRTTGKSADYEILWGLVGNMTRGDSKAKALWHYKWVFFRGLHSFHTYHDLDVLILTITTFINVLKALVKNKEIINQERLKDLAKW